MLYVDYFGVCRGRGGLRGFSFYNNEVMGISDCRVDWFFFYCISNLVV